MGFGDAVTSPTFTVSRSYPVRDGLTLHHFDFYRLEGFDVAANEIDEILSDPKNVAIVEWAGNIEGRLPGRRVLVELAYGEAEDQRNIAITSLSPELSYVLEGLQ